MFWFNELGQIIVDSEGRPIDCDECPCGGGWSSSSSGGGGIVIPLVNCGTMTVPETLYVRPRGTTATPYFSQLPCPPCRDLIEGSNTFVANKTGVGVRSAKLTSNANEFPPWKCIGDEATGTGCIWGTSPAFLLCPNYFKWCQLGFEICVFLNEETQQYWIAVEGLYTSNYGAFSESTLRWAAPLGGLPQSGEDWAGFSVDCAFRCEVQGTQPVAFGAGSVINVSTT
jgi:hypothetical protein